jgi:hypothetical protein
MKEQKKLRKESNDEEIAPAVAKCHALRKTGKLLNKVPSMRFKKKKLDLPAASPRRETLRRKVP